MNPRVIVSSMDIVMFTVYVYINHDILVDDYRSTKIVILPVTSCDKVVCN